MITFIPKRPDVLTERLYNSKAGSEALDRGFEWYCSEYNDLLQRHTHKEAQPIALHAGMYMVMLELQQKVSFTERLEQSKCR